MYNEFKKETKSAGRCPKCNKETLQYDQETGKIHCTNCGYEQIISQGTK